MYLPVERFSYRLVQLRVFPPMLNPKGLSLAHFCFITLPLLSLCSCGDAPGFEPGSLFWQTNELYTLSMVTVPVELLSLCLRCCLLGYVDLYGSVVLF